MPETQNILIQYVGSGWIIFGTDPKTDRELEAPE